MGTNLVGDFGSGGPRGPRGRGVKFRGVIKGHLWQIFKSLDLRQFLSIWAHIRPKNCPPVWIIWIWSKNSGNIPWGSCSPQKVFLLLLNYAPPASHFFPNFWTFFNNLEHRENFETLSSGLTPLVLEWEQKPTFLTRILDKIANSGKTLHVKGPSGKKIFLPHEKPKIFVYWTFVCDQVYGQDTGSKTVNFGHFLPFPYWKWFLRLLILAPEYCQVFCHPWLITRA